MSASQTKGFPFSEKKCHEVTKGDGVVNLLSAKHNAINMIICKIPPTFREESKISRQGESLIGKNLIIRYFRDLSEQVDKPAEHKVYDLHKRGKKCGSEKVNEHNGNALTGNLSVSKNSC